MIISAICMWQVSFSQDIPLDSVQYYDGKNITICAEVKGTYVTKGEHKVTYLNFGEAYPNTTFTAVIFESALENFKYIPSEHLNHKNLCVTGKVSMYRGKPQIIVSKETQILIDSSNVSKF